jgi:hypothetical protein
MATELSPVTAFWFPQSRGITQPAGAQQTLAVKILLCRTASPKECSDEGITREDFWASVWRESPPPC